MVRFSELTGRAKVFRGNSFLARLPDHYINYLAQLERPGKRIHDEQEPSAILDYKMVNKSTQRIERVPDTPVNVVYPEEADKQIWGGEGVVKGFFKYRTFYGVYAPNLLYPTLFDTVQYSEILDTYMKVTMTEGALMQVDECHGFDYYLLKTPVQDFKSRLALRLRRKLLMSLAMENYHPNDPVKREYVKEKYKEFVIPLEEAEYTGLTVNEAVTQLKVKEGQVRQTIPLKVIYAEKLMEELKEKAETGEIEVEEKKDSMLGSLTGIFKKSSKEDKTT